MPNLANAPLIEAIFELRWGKVSREADGVVTFGFADDDTAFFVGRFHAEAKARGFVFTEPVNPRLRNAPHVVSHRFRKAANVWPCYQVGVGIFTANQVNDGYDWPPFKTDILAGLEMLTKAHPSSLEGLPPIAMELRYLDGFLFEPGETPTAFLQNKINFSFAVPQGFLDHPAVGAAAPQGTNLGFQVKLTKPNATLAVTVNEGAINGKPGFIMDTTVRSSDESRPTKFTVISLGEWLDHAHAIQRTAFESFIKPVYMKSFK